MAGTKCGRKCGRLPAWPQRAAPGSRAFLGPALGCESLLSRPSGHSCFSSNCCAWGRCGAAGRQISEVSAVQQGYPGRCEQEKAEQDMARRVSLGIATAVAAGRPLPFLFPCLLYLLVHFLLPSCHSHPPFPLPFLLACLPPCLPPCTAAAALTCRQNLQASIGSWNTRV